ncbi:hypothetical protein Rhopal_007731-T1 [Rhodotorula paludigena]|uniref:Uncharacterized protein n=1 Tax=Rhodotorula paludigena TaxID=86838 RepID=A0AAV5GWI2_9BASI|nr:hypothetical protein Rhopal_007731-T1 [Rhodotorula paludigena]
MGLSQEKLARLFAASPDPETTEEIVLAYCFAKWTNGGNQHQVLRKLHLLTLYLRAVQMGPKLRDHYAAFAMAATMTKTNPTPLVILPQTALGLEAWNAARRPSKSVFKRAFGNYSAVNVVAATPGNSGDASDAEPTVVTAGRSRSMSLDAPPAGSGGFGSWLSGGGRRSRSGTVIAVVVAPGQRTEQERLAAGAGSGLGTGLLSAPPNYDGGLASYLESDPSLRASARAYDPDVDVLPNYS